MSEHWQAREERASSFMLWLLVKIARGMGRTVVRVIMAFTALYFVLTSKEAVQASRQYLARVLSRPVRWRDTLKHFFTFATVGSDRIFLFSRKMDRFEVQERNADLLLDMHDKGQGCLLIVAHFGSFEVMRVLGLTHRALPIRILQDKQVGQRANQFLDALDPELVKMVIDTGQSDVDRVLKVQEALVGGEMVGLMADRFHPGDRTAVCDFLGDQAEFPTSPWMLAALLKVPVVLCFGAYLGGNRYELHCELFAEQVTVSRKQRDADLQVWCQRYADVVAARCQQSPYNWFNFYDFWLNDSTSNQGLHGQQLPGTGPRSPT